MSDLLYEFAAEVPAGRRRKWPTALLACPVIAAAVWGIVVLERMRLEALLREAFELRTGFYNQVLIATSRVPEVRDEHLRFLARYPRLQKVDLSGTISGDLRSLREIDDLRVLDLRDCAWVDDEQSAHLAELTNLKSLSLSGTSITDAGLLAISKLPRLSNLSIERCQGITDAGLDICAEMNQLRSLWLSSGQYGTDGLLDLRKQRPDLFLQVKSFDGSGRPRDRLHTGTLVTFALVDHRYHNRRPNFHRLKSVSPTEEPLDNSWTIVGLRGGASGRLLKKLLPLTPKLESLTLEDATIEPEDIPLELVPQQLRSLTLKNVSVTEAFLRSLCRHTALKYLGCVNVAMDGVDPAAPAFEDFTMLHQMRLQDVTINEVELTEPAMRPLVMRLREQLPDAHVFISSTKTGRRIGWGDFVYVHQGIDPISPRVIDVDAPE